MRHDICRDRIGKYVGRALVLLLVIPRLAIAAGFNDQELRSLNEELNANTPQQVGEYVQYQGGLATRFRQQKNYRWSGVMSWNASPTWTARMQFERELTLCRDDRIYALTQERGITVAESHKDQDGGPLFMVEVVPNSCPTLIRRPNPFEKTEKPRPLRQK